MEYNHIVDIYIYIYTVVFIISFIEWFDPNIYLKFHIISIILSYENYENSTR